MAITDRIQIDDHFAKARARSATPAPGIIGLGQALGGLAVLACAVAATWWWALQAPAGVGGDAHPLPTTVAERQGAVVERFAAEDRGPRLGGETSAQYQARLAASRAHQDAPPAEVPGIPAPADRALAASPAPAAAMEATAPARAGGSAAPTLMAGLVEPDGSARHLARLVNDSRQQRAAHLVWLDACQKQHLVDLARAQIASARDASSAHAAQIAAQNLAADIDTHQREARRVDELLTTSEQRLADYCAVNGQRLPPLENPPETASGRAAQPRPMPAAAGPAPTIRPVASSSQRQNLDPFAQPGR